MRRATPRRGGGRKGEEGGGEVAFLFRNVSFIRGAREGDRENDQNEMLEGEWMAGRVSIKGFNYFWTIVNHSVSLFLSPLNPFFPALRSVFVAFSMFHVRCCGGCWGVVARLGGGRRGEVGNDFGRDSCTPRERVQSTKGRDSLSLSALVSVREICGGCVARFGF